MKATNSRQTPELDPPTVVRLAFVRLLFLQGIDQSQLPDPLNVTSVLSLHDASELLLGAIADHLGASLPKHLPFMDHWKHLSPEKLPRGVALPAQQRMDRVNELRNSLKHKGTLPSKAAVDLACADVKAFLEDSTMLVFGQEFDAIDMALLVPQERIRDKVRAASAKAENGELFEAIGLLGQAYGDLFDGDGTQPHREVAGFGPTIETHMSDGEIARTLWRSNDPINKTRRPPGGASTLATQIGQVTRAVQELQQALRVMALGVDYRQFFRFQQLTAWVDYADGTKERDFLPQYMPAIEEFDHCRQFVIAVALRLGELDVYAAEPSWWAAI